MFVTEQKLNNGEKINKHVEFLFVYDDYAHMSELAKTDNLARVAFSSYTGKYNSFRNLLETRFTKVSQLLDNRDNFEDTPEVDLRVIIFQISVRIIGHQIKSIGEKYFSKSYPHVIVILRDNTSMEKLPNVDMGEIWLDEIVPARGIVKGKYYSNRDTYKNGLGVLMEFNRTGDYFSKRYNYCNIPALNAIVNVLNSDKYDKKPKRKK
jgi:hypothetical protein